MGTFYRPTWVEINLSAVADNVKAFRHALPENTKLMAVVKANAYGHGAYEVALEALKSGATWLGVASLDEALQLRRRGLTCPILVMGYMDPAGFKHAIHQNVSITLFDFLSAQLLEEACESINKIARVHIKVDTGMGRLGLIDEKDILDLSSIVHRSAWLDWEGLFTHYACADELDKLSVLSQSEKLDKIILLLAEKGLRPSIIHAGNSATGIDLPRLTYDMLRLGISLYGLYPSNEVDQDAIKLQPVMTWKTKIVHLKQVPPGTPISYGGIYRTQGTENIATLPIGYADGYTRLLTGKGEVIVRGKRAPIVGRICMDQLMINVTHVPDVQVGDEAVLLGMQQHESITAEDLAEQLGTINYEIPCKVGMRVPRVYFRNGIETGVTNYIE